MKALFIGGTGVISTPISRMMVEQGWELYLLNRGTRSQFVPEGAKVITADINDEENAAKLLKGVEFDLVADFIAFTQEHVERDYRLFAGKTRQYIFISSASAYQKPLGDYRINEGTPLANPYWLYSRNKIACEDFLVKQYRENGFPITIVRPSHTYGERRIPVGVEGDNGKGSWQVMIASIYCREKKYRQHPDILVSTAIPGHALDNKHLPYGLSARAASIRKCIPL